MNKHLIKTFLVFVISILCSSSAFGQGKQEIPKDFFMGKWGGNISGAVVDKQPGRPTKIYPFSIELVGHPAKLGIGPFGGGAEAWMKMDATWPDKFTLVDTSVGCLLAFGHDYPFFTICYPASDPASMGYNALFYLAGFTAQIENENLIRLISGGVDKDMWEHSYASGELHRIYVKKDTLGKTVQINEPIKTDKFTQREIVVPNIGEVTVNINSECKFKEDKLLEQVLGEITTKLDKLREEGYDFKVRSPQAVIAVRGTQFITKVEKDGTTTLTVLDGEVEFSDKAKKKTVVVKKNQRSICKPGGLPSEPVSIDPNQIPRWWE